MFDYASGKIGLRKLSATAISMLAFLLEAGLLIYRKIFRETIKNHRKYPQGQEKLTIALKYKLEK